MANKSVRLNHWYKKIGAPGQVVEVSDLEADRIVKGGGGVLVDSREGETGGGGDGDTPMPEPEGGSATDAPEETTEPEEKKPARKSRKK